MIPISASTRIGRHWSNDIRLDHPNIPMYWIEFRWRGQYWCWRALSARDRTLGTGTVLDDIWRKWSKGGTIRLDGLSIDTLEKITCIKGDRPSLMLEDLQNKKRYIDEQALKYIEVWSEGKIIPIDDTDRNNSLEDGDIFISMERVFRLHCSQDVFVTNTNHFNISSPEVSLEINLKKREASFILHHQQAIIQGSAVLTLATYAHAVLEGVSWIETTEALEHWKKIGGQKKSKKDRLGWERGRIRNQLSQQGCFALNKLFKSRRVDHSYEISICFTKEQISFIDSDI